MSHLRDYERYLFSDHPDWSAEDVERETRAVPFNLYVVLMWDVWDVLSWPIRWLRGHLK